MGNVRKWDPGNEPAKPNNSDTSVDIRNLPPATLSSVAADWFYRPLMFLHEFKSIINKGLNKNVVIKNFWGFI